MKITDVKVIRANRGVFAKIYTDEGITGIGESGAWGALDAYGQLLMWPCTTSPVSTTMFPYIGCWVENAGTRFVCTTMLQAVPRRN